MSAANHGFNPFLNRQRNTKVKWFETDLEAFYNFVEEQPLLTAEQELKYGKAIRTWIQIEAIRDRLSVGSNVRVSNEDMANQVGCSPKTIEKLQLLAEFSKSKLVNCNLKLVLAIVSRYRTSAIPNAELISEGTRGLSKAVLRYDHSKGFRFATYATWYVHQAVADYVRWRKHPAKMPSKYLLLWRKVKQFTTEFKAKTKKSPSVADLSAALGESPFDIVKILSMQTYPTLLHTPIKNSDSKGDGRIRTMEDMLPSASNRPPLALSNSKDLRRDMEKMLFVNLNDVERDVLRLRLGLDDGRVKAVKEVGKRFKISWKQVRNVEKEALIKLSKSQEIGEFVKNCRSVSA